MNASKSRTVPAKQRLPLTPFEEYLWHEDRKSYPSWMILKASFRGSVDREAFNAASRKAFANHPLVMATLERSRSGRYFWKPGSSTDREIRWIEGDRSHTRVTFPPLDLENDGVTRVFVVVDSEGFDCYFQVHHAAIDGLGGLQILREILIYYDRELGVDIRPPVVKTEGLAERNRFLKGPLDRIRALPSLIKGLAVSRAIRKREGSPLVGHSIPQDDDPYPSDWPCVVCHRSGKEVYPALRKLAKSEQVSVNEVLLRDFQVALGEWRRRRREGEETDWIRVAVPISMRGWEDRYLTAANVLGVVTLDRQMKSLKRERRERLLFRAHEDMQRIRKEGLDALFPRMLALYRLLPGGIPARFGRERGESTAVLTHLGKLFSSGPQVNRDRRLEVTGAVLEDVRLTAPLRPQSLVSVDTYVYANRLCLDCHYDGRFLTEEDARELLQEFVDEIHASLAEAESEPKPTNPSRQTKSP